MLKNAAKIAKNVIKISLEPYESYIYIYIYIILICLKMNLTWVQAQSECEMVDGFLVEIYGKKEQKFLSTEIEFLEVYSIHFSELYDLVVLL